MMTLVSVVLPTYNRCAVLPRAVASVLGQSYADLELIVVDDGSEDGTGAYLASITDPRLRIIRQVQRGGAARARNAGIRAARGALIAFQDSDDEWLPGKLDRQVALLRASPADVGWVGGAYRVDGDPVREVSSANLVRGQGYDIDLLVGEPFVTPTWLVRRVPLLEAGLFDETMPCLEDWDLVFKLAARCRFRAVEELVLTRYGSHDSLFGDLAKRMAGLEQILTRHRERWLQAPRLHARWCAELGRLHGLRGEREASRTWLKQAWRLRPWRPATAALLAAATIDARLLRRVSRSRLASPA